MNKLFKSVAFVIVFLIGSTIISPGLIAKAATNQELKEPPISHEWGQKTCPGIKICNKNCGSNNCVVYAIQKHKITFTASECKTIAKRAQMTSSMATWIGILVGLKKGQGLTGIIIGLYGNSVTTNSKMYEYAAAQNKGLVLQYEYAIHRDSYSLNSYRKGSYYYR